MGGGTAGWVAAAALAKVMGSQLDIELVESEEIGTVGVGEATIPQIRLLTQVLGINEDDFLKNINGTIKLGIQFNGWGLPDDSYMHAFGAIGVGLGMLTFHPYWLRAQQSGQKTDLWDYSLNYQAAINNRFARMDRVGDTPVQAPPWAFHFDAGLVAGYLRRFSEQLGVKRTEGRIVDTVLRPDDGFIQSVKLTDGGEIAGDLFIDCSGFRGLLIEQALETGYEPWTHWLPCDRAIAVPCASTEPLQPYTQATAREAGWQWRIPLQNRIGNGHVYASDYIGDDQAQQVLLDNLDGEPLAEPRLLRFTTGRRKKFWNKNCVALGLASGFMEPLESTSIHLVQSHVNRLIQLFPDRQFNPADIREYNRQCIFEFERIRDFLILHYHLNQRREPFWVDRQNMDIPDGLAGKIELFKANGRIVREGEDLFTEVAWLQVMIGQNLIPAGRHPMADQLSEQQLAEFMGSVRQIISGAVAGMPTHADFIAHHCAADPA
ncbi:MAG: tryptophan 7-halogenase [Xanthomonadales bacterium]|nr:tryptophan 7-halogenase [Xanthomonadales bacterium]